MAKEKEVEKEKKKSGGLKNVIIIILALLVLGAAAFGGFYFYKQSNAEPKEEIIVQTKVPVGEQMTVNLNSENAKRYLKVSVSLGYDSKDKATTKEIEQKGIEIKDKTLFYLKSRKLEDFETKNEKNLKAGLVEEINELLVEGEILDVYFTDLLTQ